MTDEEKLELYLEVGKSLNNILAALPYPISRMATMNCLLSEAFSYYYWTGFYLLDEHDPKTLLVGPYQGTMGCLRIAYGKGVCGVAAQTKETQIVGNVHELENHIACDSLSCSEIVVPVFDKESRLMGVFDVDSTEFDSFNDVDKRCLEKIIKDLFA